MLVHFITHVSPSAITVIPTNYILLLGFTKMLFLLNFFFLNTRLFLNIEVVGVFSRNVRPKHLYI